MKKTLSALIVGVPWIAYAHPGHEHVGSSTSHHLLEAGWIAGIGISLVIGFSALRSYLKRRS